MCDIQKYKHIYNECKKLEPDDTLQLILEADTPEEQEFFEVLGDFLIQKKQKEVIEANEF